MSITDFSRRSLFCLTFVCFALVAHAELEISLSPSKTNGVYQLGETIAWQVKASGNDSAAIHQADYVLKQGGATVIGRGTLALTNGTGSIQTSLVEPGTILATVTATNVSQQVIKALGGAAVAPEKIPTSSPCPADFDAFWQAKLNELSAVPEQPVLEKGVSVVTNVDYWKLTLNNIRGTHIQGQLARPVRGEKLPAMLIVQYAGVYPLQKQWVTERAA
ncbi:MAG: acetylxylan esterase, partial [Verrucomicrobiota bacterium]